MLNGDVLEGVKELYISYSHFFVTTDIVEHGALSSKTTNYTAPLYLYPDEPKGILLGEKTSKPERIQNFTTDFMQAIKEALGTEPTPEEIFYYIYAVLYSNTYRTKYAEFLKIDFPRVPFTKDYALFKKMGEMGKKLVDLHLMRSDELNKPIAKFQGSGEYRVEKRKYDEREERVYINKTQYFEGIEKEVWGYQIGGYQVMDKWLKDRIKEQVKLSLEDIMHYCRVATAIRKTIDLQKAIDQIYPEIEEEIIELPKQITRTEFFKSEKLPYSIEATKVESTS